MEMSASPLPHRQRALTRRPLRFTAELDLLGFHRHLALLDGLIFIPTSGVSELFLQNKALSELNARSFDPPLYISI